MSQVWWPIMAAGCVIGVDLGGTKLLAGTVDSKLEVHHRAYRLARPDDAGALIDQLVEAVAGGRRGGARARCSRWASASRASSIPATGVALDSNHLPLHGVAVRDVLAERLGLPVAVDNDGNAALLAEWRLGEARGAQQRDHADARHRHRRRPARRWAPRARRAAARRPSSATSSSTPTGRRARATARTTAAWRRSCRATRIGAEGLRVARSDPNSALGQRAGLGARDHRRARHRAGP